ncbi:unnamed protein product, partial [Choristocarpus tenellus]
RQAYERVYDEETDTYFYFNKITNISQWVAPKALHGEKLDPRTNRWYLVSFHSVSHPTQEDLAAKKVQAAFRRKLVWRSTLALLNELYEKEYDPETDNWFFVNKVTKETTWDKPLL